MNEQPTDSHIIQQILDGDRERFRILVERYQPRVFRVLVGMSGNREVARDAAQEVFFRAYKALHRFDSAQSFGAWIKRIAINYMLDQWKKKRVWTESLHTEEGDTMDVPDDHMDTPHDVLQHQEEEQAIWQAIQALPEKYRAVVVMRQLEDMRYEEIAEALSLPLGTVTTHLYRARNLLSRHLSGLRAETHTAPEVNMG